jgi:radical SAM enzyme (TIGR01210 family)
MVTYPASAAERDRFVLDRRPPRRAVHDPWKAQGVVIEDERTATGEIERTATVFLTGRECPWRCVMCDLWQFTTADDTPAGAIAAQIVAARAGLRHEARAITQLKLYNAGSFFDPRAVPDADVPEIARALSGLSRAIVESHPSLVGDRTRRLVDSLASHASAPRLEVAMGLETAHPDALEQLHKRMTLDSFARAAGRLSALGAALRVFLLVSPPFVPCDQQDDWLTRSVDAAFAFGASVVSLIPTRSGNGAIDAISADGAFTPPRLRDLERSLALAFPRRPGLDRRVFADLWDLDRFADCAACLEARRARLHAMNLSQAQAPGVECLRCGGSSVS